LLDVDIVKAAIKEAHEYVAVNITRLMFWTFNFELAPHSPLETKVESPAEAVFLIWWLAHQYSEPSDPYRLKKQVEVKAGEKSYRFDFVVTVEEVFGVEGEQLPVAVEIDGHAFHEKTRDQVSYRNKRDRDLQVAGYQVLHFSYSELVKNPIACVEEVHAAASSAHERISYDRWQKSKSEGKN